MTGITLLLLVIHYRYHCMGAVPWFMLVLHILHLEIRFLIGGS